MSHNKAIEHNKEHRKEYRGAKACDVTCRNHGGCSWCEDGRTYSRRRRESVCNEKIREFTMGEYANGGYHGEEHGDVDDAMDREHSEHKVEFVSYNGRYPNLCSGILVLRIDGEEIAFDDALTSGGCVSFSDDWDEYIGYGPWVVNVPEKYRALADKISECVNENVEWGCCGGCV